MSTNFYENTDMIYLVNLKRRPDRLIQFNENVKPILNKDIHVIEAADGQSLTDLTPYRIRAKSDGAVRGAIGCMLSHEMIVKDAYEKGYKYILILEDDIHIPDPENFISDINKSAAELPENWQMLYLGGTPHVNKLKSYPDLETLYNYSPNLYKARYVFGSFAYFMSRDMIERIYNDSNSVRLYDHAYDRYLVKVQNEYGLTFTTPLRLVTAIPSYSDIQNKDMTYQGKYKEKIGWGRFEPTGNPEAELHSKKKTLF